MIWSLKRRICAFHSVIFAVAFDHFPTKLLPEAGTL